MLNCNYLTIEKSPLYYRYCAGCRDEVNEGQLGVIIDGKIICIHCIKELAEEAEGLERKEKWLNQLESSTEQVKPIKPGI